MTQKANRLVVGRRAALAVTWGVTVAIAAGLGWMAGRMSTTADDAAWEPMFRSSDVGAPQASFEIPVETTFVEPPVETPPPAEELEETAAATPVRLPDVTPAPVELPPALPEPVEVVELPEIVPPSEPVSELVERADRLAEGGDRDGARAEAEALLGEYVDYSGLTNALASDGVDDVRARLDALRVLQLADLEEISTELAREMKRSYANTPEVLEAIADWRLLKPRITSLDSSIENDRVVVTGALENPDIGTVRRVLVEVEALDAAGNVLAVEQMRVKPKAIDSGSAGSFTVRFGSIDPSFVVRTRATVVKWQSEVLGSS